ncbi:MAG: hypothetical protein LBG21_01120 [Campylobacteraceae bacterium]|jgi:hypothetical protein|nr:hypothetical protein [Campylobacteraceae bacterium]
MKRIIGLAVLTALVFGFSGCESKEEKEIRLFKEAMIKEEKAKKEKREKKEKWIKTYQSDIKKAKSKTESCEKNSKSDDECEIAIQIYYKDYYKSHQDEIKAQSIECDKSYEAYSSAKCSALGLAKREIEEQKREEEQKKWTLYYEEHFDEAQKEANDFNCKYSFGGVPQCAAAREVVKKKQETETK